MLALRLARGARLAVQLRRLLVTVAAAGTGFLLLCTLGYALGHPEASRTALLRLVWCAAPLVATVGFAVSVARADPGTRPRPGLSAVGLGPVRMMLVSAASTGACCTIGSAAALALFLHLRGDLAALPYHGAARGLLAAEQPLPLPAALTLLALVPVLASVATAAALRPRKARPGTEDDPERPEPPTPVPSGLPWGVAMLAVGLAVETYSVRAGRSAPTLPMPNGLGGRSVGVLAGWALTALGLATAGPALTHHCGRLLQSARPSAVRLLAGRILQQEARRIGRPLGVLCAVASGAYAGMTLYAAKQPGPGPMSALGGLLVAGCAAATLLMAAVEARQSRAATVEELLRLGAPAVALRGAAALRTVVLVAVFLPLTWVIAELAALPLTS
ncbi:hypothetical protein [Streptomyces sp. NPDC050560]|uniref:hypothetical protein n=1 Tax=Streptomyces sp. NPDC050560 TaxID=3365630 RepID=UPI0037A93B5E